MSTVAAPLYSRDLGVAHFSCLAVALLLSRRLDNREAQRLTTKVL